MRWKEREKVLLHCIVRCTIKDEYNTLQHKCVYLYVLLFVCSIHTYTVNMELIIINFFFSSFFAFDFWWLISWHELDLPLGRVTLRNNNCCKKKKRRRSKRKRRKSFWLCTLNELDLLKRKKKNVENAVMLISLYSYCVCVSLFPTCWHNCYLRKWFIWSYHFYLNLTCFTKKGTKTKALFLTGPSKKWQ